MSKSRSAALEVALIYLMGEIQKQGVDLAALTESVAESLTHSPVDKRMAANAVMAIEVAVDAVG
jgi:hypothetical protein